MKQINIYYQDFHLNAMAFNDSDLVLNETNAVLVGHYDYEDFLDRMAELGINLTNPSFIEIADACFKGFNLYSMELASHPSNFKNIGHTSMSVGDYVTIFDPQSGDEDVLICAKAGWKNIPSTMSDFINERDKIIKHIMNMPIDILSGMFAVYLADKVSNNYPDFKKILNLFKDKRCEDNCPKCGAGTNDIDWGIKDYSDSIIFQNATCQKCGCHFTEEYEYARTSVDEETEAEIKSE